MKATVEFRPAQDGDFVIFKECWSADYRGATAVFLTKGEAMDFCWKHWRVPADEVRVVEPQGQGPTTP